MIELYPLKKSEMQDYFSDDNLNLPDHLRDIIRKIDDNKETVNVGKSKTGNIFYNLMQRFLPLGTTWALLRDPLYTPLTSINSSIDLIETLKKTSLTEKVKKFEENLARNKYRLLSKLEELYDGVNSGAIRYLDLNPKATAEVQKGFKFVIDLLRSNQYKPAVNNLKGIRDFYIGCKNFEPEDNIKDAEKLITAFENV